MDSDSNPNHRDFPHRGGVLIACAVLGIALPAFGLPYSIAARVAAGRDLRAISSGRMTEQGTPAIRNAHGLALIGIWTNGIACVGLLVLFAYFLYLVVVGEVVFAP